MTASTHAPSSLQAPGPRGLGGGPAVTATRPTSCLPELVAEQAARTPDAVAVLADGERLTYRELDERANYLAGQLRSFGARPGAVVGVLLPRGADLIVALLAVGRAGAAALPLAPEHPRERLAMILADADPLALVIAPPLRATAAPITTARLIDPAPSGPADADGAAGHPPSPPSIEHHNGDLAYIAYTSGSTGLPKGVEITHAGIRNRVMWTVDEHRLGPGDRILQKTTISFDAAIWEVYAPLVVGGTVVMAPPGAQGDPAELLRVAAENDVTVLQFVPSLLAHIVEEPGLDACTALRLVLSAGEPLPTAIAARLVERTGAELYNTYGPTECSIDATAYHYTGAPAGSQVPIGVALPNLRALVVTDSGGLAVEGEEGELHLGGLGLARGYLGRPGLTADRFVPDPFSPEPGARLYRTGDFVRRGADDVLTYLGRRDGQLKVRGVRIEAGEVEARLRELPGIIDAAVVSRRDGADEPLLTGFLLVRAGADVPAADEIRAHLLAGLPSPAVPARFVPVDRFPVTGTGKIDRTALTGMPLPALPARAPLGQAPRNADEELVVSVWAEILGLPATAFGVDDDFFTLGGHSLSAARVAARLRAVRAVELPLAHMFEARTPARLARALRTAPPAGSRPQPVDRTGPVVLSPAQERLWVREQFDPGSPEYLLPVALHVRGPLDLRALRRALAALVDRHEILRTRYLARAAGPVQVIDPPTAPHLRIHDATDLADAALALRPELDRGFRLDKEHPLRVAVARIGPAEHVLLLVLHHIAADGWSMDPLARDLAALYQSADRDPLPVQYADYAVWHRRQLDGPALDADRAYWHDALAGLAPLRLPTDHPRPAYHDIRGATHTFTLTAQVVSPLLTLGAARRATPFMTLLAAFIVLLGRWVEQDDVAVAVPVAGRGPAELDVLVGFFVNTLVLRTDLGPGVDGRVPTFVDILDRVRACVQSGLAHEHYPVDRLIAELAPGRSPSSGPLISTYFQIHDDERAPFALPGLTVEPFRLAGPSVISELALSMQRCPDGSWTCDVEYATALFEADTIRRLADRFIRLVAGAAAGPDGPIAAAGKGDPTAIHLPGLIGRWAAATPEAPAVISDAGTLSHGELDARANRLARHLLAAGVGRGHVVGVLTGRTPDLVVAWLAVLRAGATYLPLNPHDPDDRLAELVRRAHVGTVLTLSEHAARLTATGARVLELELELDGHAATIGAWPATPPDIAPHPRDLAYIIHTSGSTGRPKGVMIEHHSYLTHCQHMARTYSLHPDSRVAFMAAVTFDAAMDQIAAPLLVGGSVVLLDPRNTMPADLVGQIDEHRVTVVDVTPAYYRAMVASLRPGETRLGGLEIMSVGGDVVGYPDARDWLATGLPGQFACTYGPTEATIACTYHPVGREEALASTDPGAVPLGRALPETDLYVLDPDGRPVPAGAEGELYIGGDRVARGYLDDPRLTADRFRPDPFTSRPGARMYRTGDRVRRRADAVFEFLGRIDRQVKIRGFRIEPAEVEAALAAHPGTRAAAVAVRELRPGDPALVGYAVPRAGVDPATYPNDLRTHLTSTLPAHLVPARLIVLDILPLTRNGKVDREALPDPAAFTPARSAADEPAADDDPLQRQIAAIWREVLSLDRVGAQDGFFTLGGHSLLATQVCLRIRETFSVAVTLRQFFASPTVAGLAQLVRQDTAAAATPTGAPVQPPSPAHPQEER